MVLALALFHIQTHTHTHILVIIFAHGIHANTVKINGGRRQEKKVHPQYLHTLISHENYIKRKFINSNGRLTKKAKGTNMSNPKKILERDPIAQFVCWVVCAANAASDE